MTEESTPHLLTVAEVASRLYITEKSVQAYSYSGTLTPHVLESGEIFFDEREIAAYEQRPAVLKRRQRATREIAASQVKSEPEQQPLAPTHQQEEILMQGEEREGEERETPSHTPRAEEEEAESDQEEKEQQPQQNKNEGGRRGGRRSLVTELSPLVSSFMQRTHLPKSFPSMLHALTITILQRGLHEDIHSVQRLHLFAALVWVITLFPEGKIYLLKRDEQAPVEVITDPFTLALIDAVVSAPSPSSSEERPSAEAPRE